tara:strand:- start:662 stop:1087 length:426 start_codon:yes stop_codon:yes gene_type:complete
MKTIILYSILSLFILRCSYIENNSIYKKYARKKSIEYYSNGCKKYSASFFNHKFDGPMLRWNEDCILISESNYESGKLHGDWKMYYDEGTLMHSGRYFFGQKNGYERWYYPNGNIKTEVKYSFDVQVSDMLSWDDSGNLLN